MKITIIIAAVLIVGTASAYGTVIGLYTDSSGNVGIGTTSVASQKLTVVSSGSNTVSLNSSTNTGPSLILSGGIPFKIRSTGSGDSEGTSKLIITNASNGANLLIMDSSGNTAIGPNLPRAKLDASSILLGVAAKPTGYGNSNTLFWTESGVGAHYEAFNHIFDVNGGSSPKEAMRITTAGNVGIGTTSPQNKLDVNGTVDVNGGTNIVYRCTTAGALPIGALTVNTANCGATADTGLRLK